MSMRQRAMCAFAAFHLFVIFSFKIHHGYLIGVLPHPVQSLVEAYGYLTGSSSGFSFFAPRVPNEAMVEITVHRGDSQYSLTPGAGNAERLRRVSTMLLQLEQGDGFPEGAALFGSYVFSHDAAATKVDIKFYRYVIPSVWASGSMEPRLDTVYVASFARSKDYVPHRD